MIVGNELYLRVQRSLSEVFYCLFSRHSEGLDLVPDGTDYWTEAMCITQYTKMLVKCRN